MPRELQEPFITDIERVPVQSTNIHSVGYKDGVLEVQFTNGGLYQHSGVPGEVVMAMLRSESIGTAYGNTIRGRYDVRKIGDGKPNGNGKPQLRLVPDVPVAQDQADVAQVVERDSHKVEDAGSTPAIGIDSGSSNGRTVDFESTNPRSSRGPEVITSEVPVMSVSIERILKPAAQALMLDIEMLEFEVSDSVLLTINDNAGYTYWADQMLPMVKTTTDVFEASRMETKRPLLDMGREVDELHRPWLDRLQLIKNRIEAAMTDFRRRVQAEKDAANERERQRLSDIRAKQIEDAKQAQIAQGKTEAQAKAVVEAIPLPPIVVTTAGSAMPVSTKSAARVTWKFRIIDPNLVPRHYCIPDDRSNGLIGVAVKQLKDKHGIPGVEAYTDESFSTKRG